MAVPLLAKEVPDAYATLFGARSNADNKIRLSRLEEHVFGWTHAEAAGIVARQWDLPEAFAVLIEDHLAIDKWAAHADSEPGKLAVSLSALLPTIDDMSWSEYGVFEKYYRKVRPRQWSLDRRSPRTDRPAVCDFAPVLKIAVPENSLVDRYQEAAEPVAVETA